MRFWDDAIIWPDEAALKTTQAAVTEATPTADVGEVLQIKVWLAGISPMIWRRILVSAAFSLRELHGVIRRRQLEPGETLLLKF